MSILIKDMEMPKTCHCCRMCVQVSDGDIDWHWECCLLCENVARYATDRIPDCPLVPVPPHGRLGDLDKLEQMFVDIDNAPYSGFDGTEPFYSAEDAAQIIRLVPTIIPAEDSELQELERSISSFYERHKAEEGET